LIGSTDHGFSINHSLQRRRQTTRTNPSAAQVGMPASRNRRVVLSCRDRRNDRRHHRCSKETILHAFLSFRSNFKGVYQYEGPSSRGRAVRLVCLPRSMDRTRWRVTTPAAQHPERPVRELALARPLRSLSAPSPHSPHCGGSVDHASLARHTAARLPECAEFSHRMFAFVREGHLKVYVTFSHSATRRSFSEVRMKLSSSGAP
jgi:hypothetical protein